MRYSQHTEEGVIQKYVGHMPSGTYVDIGAGDPKEFSNTYALYEKGWRGVIVEPFPKYKEQLLAVRPEDKLCTKVITNHIGEVEMINTASVETDIGRGYKLDMKDRVSYKAPCYTMKEFLEEYPEAKEPDFLSLDIEAGEEALFEKCDFNIFKPKLMCVEYEIHHIDYRKNWEKYVLDFYDRVENIWFNQFYLRKP